MFCFTWLLDTLRLTSNQLYPWTLLPTTNHHPSSQFPLALIQWRQQRWWLPPCTQLTNHPCRPLALVHPTTATGTTVVIALAVRNNPPSLLSACFGSSDDTDNHATTNHPFLSACLGSSGDGDGDNHATTHHPFYPLASDHPTTATATTNHRSFFTTGRLLHSYPFSHLKDCKQAKVSNTQTRFYFNGLATISFNLTYSHGLLDNMSTGGEQKQ